MTPTAVTRFTAGRCGVGAVVLLIAPAHSIQEGSPWSLREHMSVMVLIALAVVICTWLRSRPLARRGGVGWNVWCVPVWSRIFGGVPSANTQPHLRVGTLLSPTLSP